MTRGRRWVAAALPVAGLALAVGLLVSRLDAAKTWEALRAVEPGWLAAAVLTLVGTVAFAVLKVKTLFDAGGLPISARRAATAILASATLNAFVPGRGGDLIRGVFLVDERSALPRALALVLVERIVDIFVLGLAATVAGAAGGATRHFWLGAATCVAAGCGAGLLTLGDRSPVFRSLAARMAEAVRGLRTSAGALLRVAALSAMSWGCNVVILGLCLRAVGVPVSPLEVAQAAPLAILVGVLPISVSGIGTRDLALVALMPAFDAEPVVAGALLYTLIQAVLLPGVGAATLGGETLRSYRRLAGGDGSNP